MTTWALLDKLIPAVLVGGAYLAGIRLGRALQRLEQVLDSLGQPEQPVSLDSRRLTRRVTDTRSSR